MNVAYLYINEANDMDGRREYLSGRTQGCGCCSDDITVYDKKGALTTLAEFEAELRKQLDSVKALRKQVRKWKR